MALVKPVIFQVAGYKNSGKTTIVSKLIKQLTEEGLNVVSIKHHGHSGKPDTVPDKDTQKHLGAGALASVVEGDGQLLLQAEKNVWTLEEQIQLLSFFQPDVILIEGFKNENYPKVLLLRSEADIELCSSLNNIQAVICWEKKMKQQLEAQTIIPCFHLSDQSGLSRVILLIKNQLD